jgi:uncharacterized protein YbcI
MAADTSVATPVAEAATEVGRGVEAVARPGDIREITRAMIAIYKDQFGRGPRFAHSHHVGPDAIACLLEGTLTPAERTLAAMGEHQRLRETRMLFQYAAEYGFRSAVEEITGRQVVAFISGIDTRSDVATELFQLAPAGPTLDASEP